MLESNNFLTNVKIAIVGLGYVGLPLALEFGKKYTVVGFDTNRSRIDDLKNGIDKTKEADINDLLNISGIKKNQIGLIFTNRLEDIQECNFFIITVPTPIDQFKSPDLGPIIKASKMIGSILKKNDIVVYESTVYPGCTEEDCVPVLEKVSGLKFNKDFFAGYSPERINPGDKINTLTKIIKVTSGSTPEIADKIDAIYKSIINAGTHKARSIKVAEAAKAIENAQRDLNISFVNELALIFDRLGIDTTDVIEAASTKWNFLKFRPGLVGGHCIGVDPYYLAHKAQSLGYHPQVILSGRRVNDNMGAFVADKLVKLMIHKDIKIKGAKVLIMGITFKENCTDIRNTRVIDIYHELISFGLDVTVVDPIADPVEVKNTFGFEMISNLDNQGEFDAIIIAVAHSAFQDVDFKSFKRKNGVIFDTKSCVDRRIVDSRL